MVKITKQEIMLLIEKYGVSHNFIAEHPLSCKQQLSDLKKISALLIGFESDELLPKEILERILSIVENPKISIDQKIFIETLNEIKNTIKTAQNLANTEFDSSVLSHSIFDILPEELVVKIFSYLLPSDLQNLVLVCKKFKRIAQDESLTLQLTFNPIYTLDSIDLKEVVAISPNNEWIAVKIKLAGSLHALYQIELVNCNTRTNKIIPTKYFGLKKFAFTPDNRFFIALDRLNMDVHDLTDLSKGHIFYNHLDSSCWYNEENDVTAFLSNKESCDIISFLSNKEFIAHYITNMFEIYSSNNNCAIQAYQFSCYAALYQINRDRIVLKKVIIDEKSGRVNQDSLIKTFISSKKDKLVIFIDGRLKIYSLISFELITIISEDRLRHSREIIDAHFINNDTDIITLNKSNQIAIFNLEQKQYKIDNLFTLSIDNSNWQMLPINNNQILIICHEGGNKVDNAKSTFFHFNVKTTQLKQISVAKIPTGLQACSQTFFNKKKLTFLTKAQIVHGEYPSYASNAVNYKTMIPDKSEESRWCFVI
jgi:hypothetical protein